MERCEAGKSNNDVRENIHGYVVRLPLPRNSLVVAGGVGVGQVAGKFVVPCVFWKRPSDHSAHHLFPAHPLPVREPGDNVKGMKDVHFNLTLVFSWRKNWLFSP